MAYTCFFVCCYGIEFKIKLDLQWNMKICRNISQEYLPNVTNLKNLLMDLLFKNGAVGNVTRASRPSFSSAIYDIQAEDDYSAKFILTRQCKELFS